MSDFIHAGYILGFGASEGEMQAVLDKEWQRLIDGEESHLPAPDMLPSMLAWLNVQAAGAYQPAVEMLSIRDRGHEFRATGKAGFRFEDRATALLFKLTFGNPD